MTLSIIDRAALRALLARAQNNERLTDEQVRDILPDAETFARFQAMSIIHHNRVMHRYDDIVWERFRSPPESVQQYIEARNIRAAALMRAQREIGPLRAKLARLEDDIETLPTTLNEAFDQLTADEKRWFDTSDPSRLPKLFDDPPIEAVLPGEKWPNAEALCRIIPEFLGDE